MQVRLQSKTGPLIPSGDDFLRSLREQTERGDTRDRRERSGGAQRGDGERVRLHAWPGVLQARTRRGCQFTPTAKGFPLQRAARGENSAQRREAATCCMTETAVRSRRIAAVGAGGALVNRFDGRISSVVFLGDKRLYHVQLDGGPVVKVAHANDHPGASAPLLPAMQVAIDWDASATHLLEA